MWEQIRRRESTNLDMFWITINTGVLNYAKFCHQYSTEVCMHPFSNILSLKSTERPFNQTNNRFYHSSFYHTLDTIIQMSPNVMKLNHKKSPKMFQKTWWLLVTFHDSSWRCQTNPQRLGDIGVLAQGGGSMNLDSTMSAPNLV